MPVLHYMISVKPIGDLLNPVPALCLQVELNQTRFLPKSLHLFLLGPVDYPNKERNLGSISNLEGQMMMRGVEVGKLMGMRWTLMVMNLIRLLLGLAVVVSRDVDGVRNLIVKSVER